MAKGEYEFLILITCLLILALQIHNPFQVPIQRSCHCPDASDSAADSGGTVLPTRRSPEVQSSGLQQSAAPPPVYRRPREGSAAPPSDSSLSSGGLSTDALLRELDTIQARAKEQQDTYAAAGKMPPPSPILDHLREGDAAAGITVGGGSGRIPMQQLPPQVESSASGSHPAPVAPPPGDVQLGEVLARRADFGRFLEAHQPRGLGIVLGVGHGDFALRLLAGWGSAQGLYLVDPYVHIWRGYADPANVADGVHQQIFEELRNNLQQFEGRHVVVRDFSHSFAETYRSGGVATGAPTFVYIDANHVEQAVSRDLELWWPILQSGGIMAGSTYMDDARGLVQVRRVVDAFVAKHGLQLHLTADDSPAPAWFFVKP